MKKLNLTLNKKYMNYNMFINKYIKQENIYEILKINDLESNIIEREIITLADKINKHKIDLLLNNKSFKTVEIDENEIFNLLNKMKNFNETHFSKNNFKLNDNNDIYNYFNFLLSESKKLINENAINCDDLLSCIYFYDLLKTLHLNPEESFKLNSFSSREKPNETMKNMIYGRGFENLNKTFLNNLRNLRLNKSPTINEWNNEIILKKYNYEVENNKTNLSFNEWKKTNRSTSSIPSIDLIGEKFKKKFYIENKNFNIFNNELNIKFNYSSNKLLDRFKKLETLEELDKGRFVFYNITTYNQEKKDVKTFLIPIEAYKKDLHNKINKSLTNKLKTEIKNKRQYNYNIPLEISKNTKNGKIEAEIIVEINFNNLPNIQNLDREHYSFNVRFKNSEDFFNLFDEFNLDNEFNLRNKISKEKEIGLTQNL